MGQAEGESTSSRASSNVVSFAEFIARRLDKKLPILQASGISLEVEPHKKLTDILNSAIVLIGDTADVLSGKLKDPRTFSRQLFADMSAARLYRCGKQLELAVKEAEKLKRKLRKAKKRAKQKRE